MSDTGEKTGRERRGTGGWESVLADERVAQASALRAIYP